MATQEILFDTSARRHIAIGLDILANAVKVTLGPRGRNVVIEKSWGAPAITQDGVTVAGEIDPTKVVRVALQNAASVASLTLTTEALIAERPKHGTTTSDQEHS